MADSELVKFVNVYLRAIIRNEKRKADISKSSLMQEISNIVLLFLPKLHHIDLYDATRFIVDEQCLTVSSNGDSCQPYMIYLQCWQPNGYQKGKHIVSVECMEETTCYHAIGVTSEKDASLTKIAANPFLQKGAYAYLDGHDFWTSDEVITVVLDMEQNFDVSFYREDVLIQRHALDTTKSYYFALCVCDGGNKEHEFIFRIVKSPKYLLY
mmetsp:Transcript_3388/g.5731  ORF Transcript_3388/g.5731 Transcript_3388/m.5731 type:complete len:211 (-) Transcript_3388:114-746(-)|eukprot:CAMPEP_0197056374 /NCGR_PEP_ID=MMETSP1384-20130603/83578_1 /TAXON_ID=29189 /ORGANISM="Ammonia sp." /LENGTH=210 /DNA_ID=CAMNT_0042490329 /DNA_START=30 /DNA_END=662 /DNA_ORIENTATION=+